MQRPRCCSKGRKEKLPDFMPRSFLLAAEIAPIIAAIAAEVFIFNDEPKENNPEHYDYRPKERFQEAHINSPCQKRDSLN